MKKLLIAALVGVSMIGAASVASAETIAKVGEPVKINMFCHTAEELMPVVELLLERDQPGFAEKANNYFTSDVSCYLASLGHFHGAPFIHATFVEFNGSFEVPDVDGSIGFDYEIWLVELENGENVWSFAFAEKPGDGT